MDPMQGATTVERMLIQKAKGQGVPINGSLELLPLCNMNCRMCYVHMSREEMNRKGRLRNADEWLSLAGEMQRAGVLFLLLTGGEPLLYPGFQELYLGLKKLGMILTINTNATLLDEAWADFFAKNKPRRVNITLYGASDLAYERLCGYRGGFDKTVNAIRLLRERGVDVRVGVSVTPENVEDVPEIIRLSHEMDVPCVVDTYMVPAQRERDAAYPGEVRLAPERAAKCRVESKRLDLTEEIFAQYRENTLRSIAEYQPDETRRGISCLAGNCSFTVNWQGKMRPCVVMMEPEADVFETGFLPGWEKIQQGCKQMQVNDKCVECSLRPICPTCPTNALMETGSTTGIPEYLCRYAKETLRLLEQE